MDKTPLVSVVVPVYNMESFLPETLDSILASDYPNFEVIVVDDGSKDASYRVACDYAKKDRRVRAYTQPNGGACAARNQAVRLAEGEFILPFDADDKMSETFVSDAVHVILSDMKIKAVCPRAEYSARGHTAFIFISHNITSTASNKKATLILSSASKGSINSPSAKTDSLHFWLHKLPR